MFNGLGDAGVFDAVHLNFSQASRSCVAQVFVSGSQCGKFTTTE